MSILLIIFITFVSGGVLGGGIGWLVCSVRANFYKHQTPENLQTQFAKVAGDALQQTQASFFKVAENKFKDLVGHSKERIDTNLKDMSSTMKNLSQSTHRLEGQLKDSQFKMEAIDTETKKLNQLLSSSQERGAWGERTVVHILDQLGLIKGIHYHSQLSQYSVRPDFTFLLPRGLKVNMDVKFPLSNYQLYLDSENKNDQKLYAKRFADDVKKHIKTVADRQYVNPKEGTVDCALLFIPNESIYTFIHQYNSTLIDYAFTERIALCSPTTLYTILALIRQSVTSFNMEKQASEIQTLILTFKEQWQKFVDKMDKVGKSLTNANDNFQELTTTRTRQLEKPMTKIETLMQPTHKSPSPSPSLPNEDFLPPAS